MKNRMSFISGMLTAFVIVALVGTALAATYQKQATLEYNDIKITLDGKVITPKDANGNVVEPFIIDGTTYLPVRAVADAMGLSVGWDNETKTAILTTGEAEVEAPQEEETFLCSNNSVRFYYSGVETNADGGVDFQIKIENDSNYYIVAMARDFSVNGLSANCSFSASAHPGEVKTVPLSVSKEELDKHGISEVYRFSLRFYGNDRETEISGGRKLFQFETGVGSVDFRY